MTIPLTLNQEQTDALNTKLAEVNARRADVIPPQAALTAEQFCESMLTSAVNGFVKEAYDLAVKRPGDGAAQLDYASRQALIAQVQAQLGG